MAPWDAKIARFGKQTLCWVHLCPNRPTTTIRIVTDRADVLRTIRVCDGCARRIGKR